MARLLPKINPETIEEKPERDVALALIGSLPDDVLIIHSYPWLRRRQEDKGGAVKLQEGEADFVILWPDKGMMVLEVKGGEIKYDEHRMLWIRVMKNGHEKILTDPFAQGEKNMHSLKDIIKKKVYSGLNVDFTFGYMACFPDCRYTGSEPAGADPIIILSAPDLSRMGERIARAFSAWNPSEQPRPFSKERLKKVERAIIPAFNILPVLFRTIEAQEESLFRLTNLQLEVLQFLNDRPRALIEGVAGSGKTMLARAQADRFASVGLKTLFVCYNKNLAESLSNEIPTDYKELIDVVHFHKLCRDCCVQGGVPFDPDGTDDFWSVEAPNLMFDALENVQLRYDAIIIDEGQDFLADWWEPLEYFLKVPNESSFYVFYDPAQNLYNDEKLTFPAFGEPFKLPMNCRNTKEIASTCSKILDYPIRTREEAPTGTPTTWFFELDREQTKILLGNLVKNWLVKENIKPNQIAILCPVKINNSSLSGEKKIGGVSIVTQDSLLDWRGNQGVLFSTIRAFKGLEADVIVMIDIFEPKNESMFSPADFYVGCSRAKHILHIVTPLNNNVLQKYVLENT